MDKEIATMSLAAFRQLKDAEYERDRLKEELAQSKQVIQMFVDSLSIDTFGHIYGFHAGDMTEAYKASLKNV